MKLTVLLSCLARGLVLVCLSASFPQELWSQALIFTPTDDATVKLSDSDGNFASEDLIVRWYPHSARDHFKRAYARFDITGLGGVSVTSLTLKLTEGSDGSSGDSAFEVREVLGSSWTESSITWDTQPPPNGTTIGVWNGGDLDEGEVLQIALDPRFLRFGDGEYSLLLLEREGGGMSDMYFNSSEDSSPPQLIVNGTNLPLHAGFHASAAEGAAPLSITFENLSSANATSWSWQFGDGETSSEFEPTHLYATPGRFSVTLTVTGSGSASLTRPGFAFAHPAEGTAATALGYQKYSSITPSKPPPLKTGDQFGRACAFIGDLDGNGVGDLLIGAVGDDDGGNDTGAAWILFLKPDRKIKSFAKISAIKGALPYTLEAEDGFGRSLAAIGDLDLDGIPDIAICANYDDEGGADRGAAYVCFMKRNGSIRAAVKLASGMGGFTGSLDDRDQFGRGVACVGDLDLDGVPDLVVGATGDDDGGTDVGAVWVLFMKRDGTVKSHAKISKTSGGIQSQMETSSSLWFGMSIASLGDIDFDGVCDIGVGALLDDAVYHAAGAAYVIRLNRNGTVKDDQYIGALTGGLVVGELQAGDEFGGAVGGPGDLDGDGIPDLVVGAIRDDDTVLGVVDIFADRGAVYAFFLNSDGSPKGYQKISNKRGRFGAALADYDRIGESLGWIGDVNGDGKNDLLMGSRFDDSGGANKGAVYVVHLDDGSTAAPPAADPPAIDLQGRCTSYGCGVNPEGSLTVLSGAPKIGAELTLGLDNPLGTQGPGSLSMLLVSRSPARGYPRGILLPNLGMSGPGAQGELLVIETVPDLQMILAGPAWSTAGTPAAIAIRLPPTDALIGSHFYLQGILLDLESTHGVRAGLTNGIEVVLGR